MMLNLLQILKLIFFLQLRTSVAEELIKDKKIKCSNCGTPRQLSREIDAQLLLDDYFYHKWVSEFSSE